MPKRLLSAIVLMLLPGALARGQTLGQACSEFRVNTYTDGDQQQNFVAAAQNGDFVVVWGSALQAGDVSGIFAQRYDAGGVPQGAEFHVNTYTTDGQEYPRAAYLIGGGFVVAWESYGQDGDVLGLFGQRFDAAGAPVGTEFQVNTSTTGFQYEASIGATPDGGFVVVWTDYPRDDGGGIFGQRFDAAGTKTGPEFQVNTFTTGYQYYGRVAVNPSTGGFVVAWVSYGQDGDGAGVFAQRFDATGVPQGAEFQVNSYTTGYQVQAEVASDAVGNFMVVWSSPHDGDGNGIFARRFDSAGAPTGDEFQVNTDTTGIQADPKISAIPTGGFAVTWVSTTGDGDFTGIRGRRLGPAGAVLGPEFQVNTYTTSYQFRAKVAGTPNGGFVVSWTSQDQDGSERGVFASLDCSRLYTVPPCRVVDTRLANGPTGGPALIANLTRSFPIPGACGIPADARAVALNVTAVNPTDIGDLRLYPTGLSVPLASTINFVPGRTRANNANVPLGATGEISVQCDMPVGSAGRTHLLLDVFGYFKR